MKIFVTLKGDHDLTRCMDLCSSDDKTLNFIVDAKYRGNKLQYANHSCNAANVKVYVGKSDGNNLPLLCTYALEDIQPYTFLHLYYGETAQLGFECQCGDCNTIFLWLKFYFEYKKGSLSTKKVEEPNWIWYSHQKFHSIL